MTDHIHSEKPKVTLEELLHLKRAERPDPAFWEEFDRELHRRQLAAIVRYDPWYVRLARGSRIAMRRFAPVAGAAALAAGGFFVWTSRHSEQPTAAQVAVQVPKATEVPAEAPVQQLSPMDLSAPAMTTPVSVAANEVPSVPEKGRFVIWEVASSDVKTAKFIPVTSPDTLPAPDIDLRAQSDNTLQGVNAYRTLAYSGTSSY